MDSWDVPSESISGKTYRVMRDDEGRFSCTCPDYRYRHRECKHIRLIRRLLEVKKLTSIKESPILNNPMIRWNLIEKRIYQIRIAEKCLDRNSLVVLPTALGKTMIAVYLAAYYLYNYPDRKVLVMAPTKPLVHQHAENFLKLLRIRPREVKVLTGELRPEYRLHWWSDPEIKLYLATPEVVRNDLDIGLNLRGFSLLVFDEAHRARKAYAYSLVADAYMRQSPCPVILGLTASPGGDYRKVKEIVEKLHLEHLEYRSEFSEDVKPYLHEVETSYRVVDPPESYGPYIQLLREMLNERLAELIKAGVLKKDPEYVFRKDLLEVGDMLRYEVEATMLEEERGRMWHLIATQSEALIIYHAVDLLLSQGQHAFIHFLEKILAEKRRQAHRRLAKDPRLREILDRIRSEKLEEHPKIYKLLEVLEDQVRRDPEGRILVFTQYRSSAQHIAEVLKGEGYRAEIFVGQGRRGRREVDNAPTMTQKEQLETLRRFRDGELQILVATSIGEEGLDIPQCDLVVFYEPIPSEVRLIQRRGRTGRVREGRCVILAADKTLDMAYLAGAMKRAKKMRDIIEEVNKSILPVRKRRIWPEKKPLDEEYMRLADEEFEELTRIEARAERPGVEVRLPKPVEPIELKKVLGAPEPGISILGGDEGRLLQRSFRAWVSRAAKHILREVLSAGLRGVSKGEVLEGLELNGYSPGAILAALKRLKAAEQIYEEDGRLYPYSRKLYEKGLGKIYRIYVENVYMGKIVAEVDGRFRAVAPIEFCDTSIPLRRRHEYLVLGEVVKVDGKTHLRIHGIIQAL